MSRPWKLTDIYSTIGIPLDRVPYTDAMDRIVASLEKGEGNPKGHHETSCALVDLRKRGRLPKVGRAHRSQ